jgi:hypothetical protein
MQYMRMQRLVGVIMNGAAAGAVSSLSRILRSLGTLTELPLLLLLSSSVFCLAG